MPNDITIHNGTKIWCPSCDRLTSCHVVNSLRRILIEYTVHALTHDRKCNSCGHVFTTVEVNRSVVNELLLLRRIKNCAQSIRHQQARIDELLAKANENQQG